MAQGSKAGRHDDTRVPNLLSACQAVINDPQNAVMPGPEGQRSMWVLYGDPRWQDPLMVHRWGYTPQSLAVVMHEAGLTNLRQEPAQFKLREPRDMRIVGEKPLPEQTLVTLAIHILCAGNEVSVDSLSNSVLASDRLRLAPAAQAARESNFSLSMGDNIPHHADIVLVGKLKLMRLQFVNRNGCNSYMRSQEEAATLLSITPTTIWRLAHHSPISTKILHELPTGLLFRAKP